MSDRTPDEVRQAVRERYAAVAGKTPCCGSDKPEESSCCDTQQSAVCCDVKAPAGCCEATEVAGGDVSERLGYSRQELESVPEGANLGLGCGNPQAIADLRPGEVVVDLGSGGGLDCFLAAQQVGDAGRVIGVDMTPEMIHKARANAAKGGYPNVEFRLGEIEHLPVADNSADAVISNCVINLSPDKPQVYRDAFRVLKPGGRIAISDVLRLREFPETVRESLDLLCGCVSGAASREEVESMLREIGFVGIDIDVHERESRDFIREWAPGSGIEDYVAAAMIGAVRPSENDPRQV